MPVYACNRDVSEAGKNIAVPRAKKLLIIIIICFAIDTVDPNGGLTLKSKSHAGLAMMLLLFLLLLLIL